nr:hypothetical protein [Actinomyces oris]
MNIKELLEWHFSEETGSPYWNDLRSRLDFDPIKEIHDVAGLRLLPDPSKDMSMRPYEDFLPRGLVGERLAGVYESGGTSGRPKRVAIYDKWLEELINWRMGTEVPECEFGNTLAVIPTGPHVVGEINRRRASRRHGAMFSVDLDPRWAKRLAAQNERQSLTDYIRHLLDQSLDIVETQAIRHLVATPPFLEYLAQNRDHQDMLNDKLVSITWGGTEMDLDTLIYLRDEVFPDVRLEGSYGNTMMLGEAKQIDSIDDAPLFSPFDPFIAFDVVDEEGESVQNLEQGRVLASHISRYALIPNIKERDFATKVIHPSSGTVCVMSVHPIPTVGNTKIVEGVY